MLPVRDSVPSGKITTDQPWLRCSLRRSSAGRAPPARGMGKVLIRSSVSIASHFRLKIESAAATTNARKRNRLGSACNMTTASSALLWLETKIAPPLMVLTRYRSITVKGEKAPINGKMMKVCRMARAPRTVRARGQDGSLTGGWLVASTLPASGGPPAKVGSGSDAGTGDPPEVDVAVDPIDGTTLLSKGLPNAISVVAMAAGRGSLYDAKHVAYMHKIATGADAAGTLNIEDSVAANLQRVARAKRMRVSNLTVVILDRPRHEDLIKEV